MTMTKLGSGHYAKQARDIFEELNLNVDLAELDAWERSLTPGR